MPSAAATSARPQTGSPRGSWRPAARPRSRSETGVRSSSATSPPRPGTARRRCSPTRISTSSRPTRSSSGSPIRGRSSSATASSSPAASPTTRRTSTCCSRRRASSQQAGELPVNVRFVIDAEEEVGGHSAVDWVGEDTGAADVGLVLDGGYATETLPSFCTALRGICYFHVTVRTGERDLHSGMVGGAALAATHALMQVLSAVLPGPDGRLPEAAPGGHRRADRGGDRRLEGAAARERGARRPGRAPDRPARRGRVHASHDRGAFGDGERLRRRLAAAPEDRAARRGAGERLDQARTRAVDGRDRARVREAPPRRRTRGRDGGRRPLVDRRAGLRRPRLTGRPDRARRVRARPRPAARPRPVGRLDPRRRSARRARRAGDRDGLRHGRARSSTRRTRTSLRRRFATGWRRPSSSCDASRRLAPETRFASPLAEELAEDVLARFLRYVVIDTQSDPDATTYPSTEKQLDLSRLLVEELRELGLDDVELTEHGYVFATVPGTVESAPTVGLIAHVDTAPGTSGTGVRPIVHRDWAGEAIRLPGDPKQVLDPAEMPGLADRVGHDLVTSDGTTLLGADDKAGVAIIVTAADRLLRDDRPARDAPRRLHRRRGGGSRHRPLRPRGIRRGLRLHVRRVGARRARDGDVLRLPARAHDRRGRACIRARPRGGSSTRSS